MAAFDSDDLERSLSQSPYDLGTGGARKTTHAATEIR